MNDNYEEIVKNVDSLVAIYMGFIKDYNDTLDNVDSDTSDDVKVMINDGDDNSSSKIFYKEDGTIILKSSRNNLDNQKNITMTINPDETVEISKFISKLRDFENVYNYSEIVGTEYTKITPIDGGFSVESDFDYTEDICVDGISGERPAPLLMQPGKVIFKVKNSENDIYPAIIKANISNIRRIFNSSSVKEMELKKSSKDEIKEKHI